MFESLTSALGKAFQSLRGQRNLTEENIQEGLKAVRRALLEADVHFKVVKSFVNRVKESALGREVLQSVSPADQFVKICHDELVRLMGSETARIPVADQGPTVVMLAGLQGSGKTTTCAKLAHYVRKRKKKRPLLVAADLQRPAAVEQLRTLGRQLGIEVYEEGVDGNPPAVCERGIRHAFRNGHDFVILDTAGRLHVDDRLMKELEEVVKRCKPHAVVLVCDAMLGQDAVNSAGEFHRRLPLTGIVLTKLDGDTRGGAALSVREVTGCPVLFAGVGEKTEDLEEFHPDRMAGRILGMGDVVGLVERAQEVLDEKDAEKAAKKLLKGRFTFEDFLKQMQMVRKLGPLKKVLGMLPGMGQALEGVEIEDGHFARLEAMILSMTPLERRDPDRIDLSRRRRIAAGSGNELQAVHNLIKQFKQMRKMFGKMGKGGIGGGLSPEMLAGKGPRKGFRTPKGGAPFGSGRPGGRKRGRGF